MAVKEEPQENLSSEVDRFTWRAEQFSALGFGHDDSFVLAHTQKSDGFFLYWGDVKKALDAGATHAQIVDWYTYPTDVPLATKRV